ncbi:RE1-silencing transcription factor A [Drosophila obscura]|uniref:RE1-silencing transcription factor A n=1 Tax=Drosophila obscura TaxID=7282 RepID=UPI001BB10626|nr:RE1-silencing transcription factor A [Drosophila obscura]
MENNTNLRPEDAANGKFKCCFDNCNYETDRAYNRWRHEASHSKVDFEGREFKCHLCWYSSDKACNIKRHHQNRHPGCEAPAYKSSKPASLVCDVTGCTYSTNRPYDMKRHIQVHNNPARGDKSFKCLLCTYSSERKGNLQRHLDLRHSGLSGKHTSDEEEPEPEPDESVVSIVPFEPNVPRFRYSCALCSYSSKRKENLARHLEQEHKGISGNESSNDEEAKPDVLQKVQQEVLKKVKREVRQKVKLENRQKPKPTVSHKCSLCSQSFKRKANLERHVDAVHNCPSDKESSPEEDAELEPEETGDVREPMKPFVTIHTCSLCNYSSNREPNLRRHMDQRHRGVSRKVVSYPKEELPEPVKGSKGSFGADRKSTLRPRRNVRYSGLSDVESTDEEESEPDEFQEEEEKEVPFVGKDGTGGKVAVTTIKPKLKERLYDELFEELENDDMIVEECPEAEETLSRLQDTMIGHKQLIAVDFNGELHWYEAIDQAADEALQQDFEQQEQAYIAKQEHEFIAEPEQPIIEEQVQVNVDTMQMEALDDELALSMAEHDAQADDEHMEYVELVTTEVPPEVTTEVPTAVVTIEIPTAVTIEVPQPPQYQPPPPAPLTPPKEQALNWRWSVPQTGNETSTNSTDHPITLTLEPVIEDDFPFWWDDGEYTKMHKNTAYREHHGTTKENIQRILRIIYDLYYKPFREDRKMFDVFQIKDSWLCATRMTRMQIIKDMYSKLGT